MPPKIHQQRPGSGSGPRRNHRPSPAHPAPGEPQQGYLPFRERIQPVTPREGGIKLNVYGVGKTGKTRLACSFPKPLLLVGTEDGTKSVSNVEGVDFVRLHHTSEVDDMVELLNGLTYQTVVLDTAGGLQDMILKEVLGLDEIPVQKSWGMTDQRTWGTIGAQTKERLRQFLDLADRHNLNVVIIAHERNFKDDNTDPELNFPTIGAALTPTAAGWLNGACDYICQTFKRQQMREKHITVGQGKAQKTQVLREPTGQLEYCLRIGDHPSYMTGFRVPEGYDLPGHIKNPSYDKILHIIRGEPLPADEEA